MQIDVLDSLELQDDISTSIKGVFISEPLYIYDEVLSSRIENYFVDFLEITDEARASIICVDVEDTFDSDDEAGVHGTLRVSVFDGITISEDRRESQKTPYAYDYLTISDSAQAGGILRFTVVDSLTIEDELILGKELTIGLSETLHIDDQGGRTSEVTVSDSLTISDNSKRGDIVSASDSLLFDDEASFDTSPLRIDILTITDIATFTTTRTYSVSDTLTVRDRGPGFKDDLTKEYHPL